MENQVDESADNTIEMEPTSPSEVSEDYMAPSEPEVEVAIAVAETEAEMILLNPLLKMKKMIQKATTQMSQYLEPEQLDSNEIQSCIEAILFMADKPLSVDKFRQMLGPSFELTHFEEALKALQERYQSVHHGIELLEIAGGYQFRTKVGRANLAKKLVKVQSQRLSAGAMETLAIVSYKQPVMKEEVDKIRGVDSSYFVRNLMEKKLIYISGRSELPGRPILYSTTQEFLEIFGLKDLSSLPPLRELEQMVPQSESDNPEDDDPKTRELRRVVGAMNKDKSTLLYYNPEEDEKS